MLNGIVELVEKHGRLTLRELAGHFRMETSALEPMLDILVGKGRLRILSGECEKGSCSGCFCADREDMISYEITDS